MYRIDYTPYSLNSFVHKFFEVDIWDRICQNPGAIQIIKNKIIDDHSMINFELLLKNENIYHLFIEEGNILNDFIMNRGNLNQSCLNELNFYILETLNSDLSKNISRHGSLKAINYFQTHAPYLLSINHLCENSEAIPYLIQHQHEIDWSLLSLNSNAISLLKNNFDKINWDNLSLNHNAYELLEQNLDLINWKNLSTNSSCVHLLEQNPDKVNWEQLSGNPGAIQLLERNLDKINWCHLSGNSKAYKILDTHFEKQHIYRYLYKMPNIEPFQNLITKYYHLIQPLYKLEFFEFPVLTFLIEQEKNNFLNKYINSQLNLNSRFLELNPHAIYLIENQLEYVDYFNLCKNPNAIHLIEDRDYLDMCLLSRKPYAISILEKKKRRINWTNISFNSGASHLMTDNLDKIDWDNIAYNIGAIDLIKDNLHRLSSLGWRILSKNSAAVSILESNIHKIDWDYLSLNTRAIKLLEKNISKINWVNLCKNTQGISLIENNLEKLDAQCWKNLSANPNAIYLLELNPEKIHWKSLTSNPQATYLLEKELLKGNILVIQHIASLAFHPNNIYLLKYISSFFFKFTYIRENLPIDRILSDIFQIICSHAHAFTWLTKNHQFFKWFKNKSRQSRYIEFYSGSCQGNMSFLKNPAIFEIDYKALRQKIDPIKEELMQRCFHPRRLMYYLETYGYDIGDDSYHFF